MPINAQSKELISKRGEMTFNEISMMAIALMKTSAMI